METLHVQRGKERLYLIPAGKSFRELGRALIAFCKRYPLAIFYGCLVVLVALVYQFARQTITLYIDGEELCTVETFSRTVEELLDEKGIRLHPRDRVVPDRQAILNHQSSRIDIYKAFEVTVIDGNRLSIIITPTIMVTELLAEEGFELGPYDRIEPAGLEKAYDGAVIRIVRVEKRYDCSCSAVPFDEIIQKNPLLDRGLSRVVREGHPGLQEELIEITIENGTEVKREVIGATLLEKPLEKVVEHGDNTTLEREGRLMEFERVMLMTATAYCPGTPGSGCPLNQYGHALCTGPHNNGYTSTGKKAVQGLGTLSSPRLVAVDPEVIPLGSLLYIEPIPGIGKIGFARAEDIGGAINGSKIDLYFDYHRDVIKFGVRRGVKVYLLKDY
ncbi:MAG: 3D domain-containing protein [Dethiobacteria bacterium]|jgi:3D (Asp-Asp-Asp) domain-containing protein